MTGPAEPKPLFATDLAAAGMTLTREAEGERVVTVHTRAPVRGLLSIATAIAAPIALSRTGLPFGLVALLT